MLPYDRGEFITSFRVFYSHEARFTYDLLHEYCTIEELSSFVLLIFTRRDMQKILFTKVYGGIVHPAVIIRV